LRREDPKEHDAAASPSTRSTSLGNQSVRPHALGALTAITL
jgi:hypothetical protein